MVPPIDSPDEKSQRIDSKLLNIKKISDVKTAVALQHDGNAIPAITASGRGKIAEKIVQLAFDNGVKVREDGPLAQMLAALDIDTPIPQEAFSAVAEILSYVYKANGQPDPFNAIFDRPLDRNDKGDTNQT